MYPAARLPGGRHLAAPLPGGRGFSAKNSQKICSRVLGGPVARQRGGRPPGRPTAGRLDPAARLRGGWIWPPGCGATTSHSLLKGLPSHLGCPPHLVQKFQEKYSVRRNTIYTPYHGLTVH